MLTFHETQDLTDTALTFGLDPQDLEALVDRALEGDDELDRHDAMTTLADFGIEVS